MKTLSKLFIPISSSKVVVLYFIGILLICLLVLMSLSVGATSFSLSSLWNYVIQGEGSEMMTHIITFVRIPRTLAALICGSCLAVSGLLLQVALHNALASASTIGVNAGSGLFVVIGAILVPYGVFTRPLFAFIGALTATLLVYFIAKRTQVSKTTIIMAGVAISSLLSAMSDALITLFPDQMVDKTNFFMGGFAHVPMTLLLYVIPIVCIALLLAFFLSSRMNVLALGDEVASSLGLGVQGYRFTLLLLASLLAAIAVSVGGIIGFVGLVVPHMMRYLIGYNYRQLVPMCIIAGMILVLTCDILARIIFVPYEIPVGIILSCIGAPFFLSLILKRRKRVVL